MIEIEEVNRSHHVEVFDLSKIGLSLYIHIPWCVKKCPYCDFNSHTLSDGVDFERYTDVLIADALAQLPLTGGRKISSVFIGGGTPSLMPILCYERLFNALKEHFEFELDCEITLEANPATLEHAPFADYLRLGINRLSLGVQTFDEPTLKLLGRIHNRNQAISAIQEARQAGFVRLNVDLMHGLPHQTPLLALEDIRLAIDLGATHISWYQLTIEPNTEFFKTPPSLPSEETLEAIESKGRHCLVTQGFDNYEVSAWVSKNDTPCRHNLNYWRFGDYLAIGAGAHGKITLLKAQWQQDERLYKILSKDTSQSLSALQGVYRFTKSRSPKDYLTFDTHPKFVQIQKISENELPFEFMMNALRLRKGVSVEEFEARTGLWVSTIDNELIPLKHQGLMVDKLDRLEPTTLGFRYVNHLVSAFLR